MISNHHWTTPRWDPHAQSLVPVHYTADQWSDENNHKHPVFSLLAMSKDDKRKPCEHNWYWQLILSGTSLIDIPADFHYRESKGGIAYNCIVSINILINLFLPLRVGGSLHTRDTPKEVSVIHHLRGWTFLVIWRSCYWNWMVVPYLNFNTNRTLWVTISLSCHTKRFARMLVQNV